MSDSSKDGRPRILCCDDDEWILELVKYALDPTCATTVVKGGKECLALAAREPHDLILLDVLMPPPSGLLVLAQLKADPATRNIPVVMLDSEGRLETVQKARELGAVGIILKPLQPAAVVEKVHGFLQKHGLQPRPSAPSVSPGTTAEPSSGFFSATSDHDEAFSLIETYRQIETDFAKDETVGKGYARILDTGLTLSGLAAGSIFVNEFPDYTYRLAEIRGLDERSTLELFNSYQGDILRSLALEHKDYFTFVDARKSRSWLALGLKSKGRIAGLALLQLKSRELPETLRANRGLFFFFTVVAYLLDNMQQMESARRGLIGMAKAFSASLDAKDPYTRGHSERVTLFSLAINAVAEKYLPEYHIADTEMRLAGLLHDIGKIGIPDRILNKEGKLTDEEFAIMKQHVIIGRRMLSNIPELRLAVDATAHHERYDGRGYPDGLPGEDIPLMGRYLCIADVFDAMTSDRPYRKGLAPEIAFDEIRKCSGTQFDPLLVDLFIRAYTEGLFHTILEMSPATQGKEEEKGRVEVTVAAQPVDEEEDLRLSEQLFARIDTVRFGSPLGHQLITMLEDPEISITGVARRIEMDPSITARILQMANSSFYGFSRRIRTVEQGIIVLGLRELRHILYLFNMRSAFDMVKLSNFDSELLWKHSLIVGLIARHLAMRFKQRRIIEDAFLAGLMHDIGKVAFISLHPDRYENVITRVTAGKMTFAQAENEEFGLSHDRAARFLVTKWNLPTFLEGALRYHHAAEDTTDAKQLSRIIRAADALSYMSNYATLVGYPALPPEDKSFELLGIKAGDLGPTLDAVNKLIGESTDLLSVDR